MVEVRLTKSWSLKVNGIHGENKEPGELIVKYKCQWLQTTHPFNLLEVNIVDPKLKCFSFALFLH